MMEEILAKLPVVTNVIIFTMKTETIHNLHIPKIGYGTWRIGGRGTADPAADEPSLLALRSALSLGYTHFDTAEGYAAGHAEELLGRAICEMGIRREALFITSKVAPEHLKYDDVLRCCENSLRRLGMDYLDLYLIHWPSASIKLEETFRALNLLVSQGMVRHLGVSNFKLRLLKQSVVLCETPLLTDQVSYSVLDPTCVRNGVLAYCQQNDILLTAYSPVKPRNTATNRVIKAIAQSRGVTPQQVALAWLVITIPMSLNPQHQADNIRAADLELTDAEMAQLNAIRKL
jgi:2,5-diketo-D-gluconate reductase B